MASTKEDGITAAAAQQVSAMSLNESSVEGKDDETENNEDAAEENEAPNKLCSACETKSDALVKCRACKCVWYCDKKCQKKHWKEHKKECKRIKEVLDKRGGKLDVGTEEDIGPLAKLPPREECLICLRALPLDEGQHAYASCCGKTICGGCGLQHQMKSGKGRTCAFCRTAVTKSDEEMLAQLRKRVERKDPEALRNLALCHGLGEFGLPVDQAKCIDLLRQSADLGFPGAQYQLGIYLYNGTMGLEQNKEEGIKFWGKAAEGGHVTARRNLGCMEGYDNGNDVAAMRHWRLSASVGDRKSMKPLIDRFEDGLLHHANLAETLQAFYRARAEMKSKDRDLFIVTYG